MSREDVQASPAEDQEHGVEDGTVKAKVKATPLPKFKMVAVCMTLLTESICITMLFPFVGLYVAHLQNISVEDAGYFTGVLVGLFVLGQVISAKLWGWLSDVYGRKLPLTLGLFAGACAMLLFSITDNIYVCCIMRFIHGFFNGNVLIAKIIISDITDSTNAALGFSMVGLLWCVGSVIGPAVGGFLYDPATNPSLRWLHVPPDSYIGRKPALLPILFVFVYAMATFLVCLIVLPETNLHRTKSIRNVPVIGWVLNAVRPKAVTIVTVTDTTTAENETPAAPKLPAMTYAKALKDPVLRTVTVIYMCISGADMGVGEILPLWAIASTEVGGLGLFSDAVGTLLLLFSIPTFVSNLFFPKIYKALDDSGLVFRLSAWLGVVSIALIPVASNFTKGLAFCFVLLMGSAKNCSTSAGFNVVHILTARAAPPGTVGSVYGISQSMAMSVRCVVPFIVAPLFAWSISGGHTFPFNHYFSFFLSVLPLFYAVFLALRGRIERTPEELAAWGLEEGNSIQGVVEVEEASSSGGGDEEDREGCAGQDNLQLSAMALQHEDWRLACDEPIEAEEEKAMEQ